MRCGPAPNMAIAQAECPVLRLPRKLGVYAATKLASKNQVTPMALLKGLAFTQFGDIFTSPDGAWALYPNEYINMLGGNDSLVASDGFYNGEGAILAGAGNDTIEGSGASMTVGIYNNIGVIDLGAGDDVLSGSSYSSAIKNNGKIDAGFGNDRIMGVGVASSYYAGQRGVGVDNNRSIYAGIGNDTISGSGYYGIFNQSPGIIDAGGGNDQISAYGDNQGINNSGTISGGAGNDTISGAAGNLVGIANDGIISMGAGNDYIDCLDSGFSGSGSIDLGAGNDVLRGFGAGTFKGGTGRDTLIFKPGTYAIDRGASRGTYRINGLMTISGFELFGAGASQSSVVAAYSTGFVTFS